MGRLLSEFVLKPAQVPGAAAGAAAAGAPSPVPAGRGSGLKRIHGAGKGGIVFDRPLRDTMPLANFAGSINWARFA